MKNKIASFINKNSNLTALAAIFILTFIGLACNGSFEVGKPAMPTDAEVQALIKQTTSDFADAVQKEDFSNFLKTTSKDFQSQYSDQQLKDAFAVFIDKKDEVVPLLKKAASTNANFSPQPSMREENSISVLDTSGSFPTDPAPVDFDISYERENGQWKLLKIKYKM